MPSICAHNRNGAPGSDPTRSGQGCTPNTHGATGARRAGKGIALGSGESDGVPVVDALPAQQPALHTPCQLRLVGRFPKRAAAPGCACVLLGSERLASGVGRRGVAVTSARPGRETRSKPARNEEGFRQRRRNDAPPPLAISKILGVMAQTAGTKFAFRELEFSKLPEFENYLNLKTKSLTTSTNLNKTGLRQRRDPCCCSWRLVTEQILTRDADRVVGNADLDGPEGCMLPRFPGGGFPPALVSVGPRDARQFLL